MIFSLHILGNNSGPTNEQSVEQQQQQQQLCEGLANELLHSQQAQTQHGTMNEQASSPNSSKRKHVALIHNNEPNKRTTSQQQQFSQPPDFGRQQSVTINELTDHDAGGWLHTTNASPLIDLVPSPPPSTQSADDNYAQQHQQNKTYPTVGNGNNIANTYQPDFILRTDRSAGANIGQSNGANLTGTRTVIEHSLIFRLISSFQSGPSPAQQMPLSSLLKEEQIDLPQTLQTNNDLQASPTLYSQTQQQHKIGQPSEQLSFSLDDITGDVDHIQSSLDNIRELMFDHLPDGTSIEDLFGEDNAFLSPLLQTISDNISTGNPLLENLQDQKPMTGLSKFLEK